VTPYMILYHYLCVKQFFERHQNMAMSFQEGFDRAGEKIRMLQSRLLRRRQSLSVTHFLNYRYHSQKIIMTTFVNRNAASYYRPQQYTAPQQAAPPRPVPDIRDDYERKYAISPQAPSLRSIFRMVYGVDPKQPHVTVSSLWDT